MVCWSPVLTVIRKHLMGSYWEAIGKNWNFNDNSIHNSKVSADTAAVIAMNTAL